MLLLSGVAFAQQTADPDRGHAYAEKVCAACHSVEKNAGPSPNPDAPIWVGIANTPGMTAVALKVFLSTPHQKMPDLVIAPSDMADLIAYILTLQTMPPL
jgi:mono/diheme cytochrome c family protein